MLKIIPTPIGNLQDVTLRALEAFKEAEVVFCEDTRVSKKLFNLLDIDYSNKTFISMHSHNENEIVNKLNKEFFEKNVIYISDAGMPGISDPGSELIRFCIENNIEYDVFTGANALLPALVASGFDSKEFIFYGFLPHKKDRIEKLKDILNSNKTSILYESPHRIEKLLQEIDILDNNRNIFLAKELTKMHQKYFRGTAKYLLENINNFKGEWVVVIEANKIENNSICFGYDDILQLPINIKEKSKLLAKISGKKPKEIYKELLNNN